MAASSISHNFVIKDKQSAEMLAEAVSAPKVKLPKPVETVSDKEDLLLLMKKWRNEK